ncbi:hypothetical protein BJ742DRAFT_781143 [Cladochytrium replicatum]|nr:hypothetical protein BJ742DRAFT_781143 [Cladochytrium replicatum]
MQLPRCLENFLKVLPKNNIVAELNVYVLLLEPWQIHLGQRSTHALFTVVLLLLGFGERGSQPRRYLRSAGLGVVSAGEDSIDIVADVVVKVAEEGFSVEQRVEHTPNTHLMAQAAAAFGTRLTTTSVPLLTP